MSDSDTQELAPEEKFPVTFSLHTGTGKSILWAIRRLSPKQADVLCRILNINNGMDCYRSITSDEWPTYTNDQWSELLWVLLDHVSYLPPDSLDKLTDDVEELWEERKRHLETLAEAGEPSANGSRTKTS